MGVTTAATTLDPQLGTSNFDQQYGIGYVSEGLTSYDYDLNVIPSLAESWETTDSKVWIFHIRQGVKWHTGRPLTAADVKFSFERTLDPDLAIPRRRIQMISAMNVIDDNTLQVTLEYPFPAFLNALTTNPTFIVPPEELEARGEAFAREPVGTGPFKVVEYLPDDRIVLERFDDYWAGPSNLDQVIIRTIPDNTVAALELEAGGVDLINNVNFEDYNRLDEDDRFHVDSIPEMNYRLLVFNTASAAADYQSTEVRVTPFKDQRVRQALYQAVDWSQVVAAVAPTEAFGVRSTNVIAFPSPYYDPSLEPPFDYDVDKARELLRDAGFENGFSTELITWEKPSQDIGVVIQGFLREVGIDLAVTNLHINTWVPRVGKGDFDLYLGFWSAGGGVDPQFFYTSQLHSKNFGDAGNRARYSNAEVDALLDQADVEIDVAKRRDLYWQAQRIATPALSQVPILSVTSRLAWADRVQGLRMHPFGGAPLVLPPVNVSVRQ